MTGILIALLVGVLFATGTYLLLRRHPIRLILGLSLLSYGINVLLFSSSHLRQGQPPIIADKATYAGEISQFVDPLPQALILTAIVISFGVTAFMIVLVNRRNILVAQHQEEVSGTFLAEGDPFSAAGYEATGLATDPDDYEWLEDTLPHRVPQPTPAAPQAATTPREGSNDGQRR
jgi:multicomponent Na+:H+ antiporter subunit C